MLTGKITSLKPSSRRNRYVTGVLPPPAELDRSGAAGKAPQRPRSPARNAEPPQTGCPHHLVLEVDRGDARALLDRADTLTGFLTGGWVGDHRHIHRLDDAAGVVNHLRQGYRAHISPPEPGGRAAEAGH